MHLTFRSASKGKLVPSLMLILLLFLLLLLSSWLLLVIVICWWLLFVGSDWFRTYFLHAQTCDYVWWDGRKIGTYICCLVLQCVGFPRSGANFWRAFPRKKRLPQATCERGAAMQATCEKGTAMPTFTLEVKALGGCVLTLEVIPGNTVKELKTMLLNKKEDSNEDRKYLNLEVQLLADNTLLSDDDQTLESLGLHGESDVMVVYSRMVGWQADYPNEELLVAVRAGGSSRRSQRWTGLWGPRAVVQPSWLLLQERWRHSSRRFYLRQSGRFGVPVCGHSSASGTVFSYEFIAFWWQKKFQWKR